MEEIVTTAKKSGSSFRIEFDDEQQGMPACPEFNHLDISCEDKEAIKNLAQPRNCPTAQKLSEIPQDTSGHTQCHEAQFCVTGLKLNGS